MREFADFNVVIPANSLADARAGEKTFGFPFSDRKSSLAPDEYHRIRDGFDEAIRKMICLFERQTA